jgi:hypothetical protein
MPTITSPQDLGLISSSVPRTAYVWPEMKPGPFVRPTPGDDEIFAFQYWPETLTDTEAPDYAEKKVPGASHPLYQWTGGTGRDIVFTAHFTAEVDISTDSSFPVSLTEVQLLPSGRYTVDVRAAVARLKSYLRGDYPDASANQAAHPPKRLYLVLENTRLGGDRDEILVILRQAPVVYQSWFANGAPRIVEVSCTFSECVQHNSGSDNSSQITYIGRSSFEKAAKTYKYRGTVDKVIG